MSRKPKPERETRLRFYQRMIIFFTAVLVLWAGAAGAETFTDEIGRTVEITAPPQRIIGLTPSLAEILFALGLGDKVVGVTQWSYYPPEANKLPKVGPYIGPNIERIVAQQPDLVLVNREGNPPWVLTKLEQAGIKVFVHWPDDPQKLPESLALLGRVCGAPEAGLALSQSIENEYQQIRVRLDGAPTIPTLLVIGSKPLVSVSPQTFHGKLLQMVRASNLAAGAPGRWPRLSLEYVIEAKPSVIVVSTMERGSDRDKLVQYWRDMPGIGDRQGLRVAGITSDLIDRPGPRLGQGLAELARIIHPDRFPEKDALP